jgi:hypothetical protein
MGGCSRGSNPDISQKPLNWRHFKNSNEWPTHSCPLKKKENPYHFQFCEMCGYKKGMTTNLFSPISFVEVFGSGILDPGSGMGKNQDPG